LDLVSIVRLCGLVNEDGLSKIVYGLGGTGGVGSDIGTGCTSSTCGKTIGVELVPGTALGSITNLFLGSFSRKLSLSSSALGSLLFSSMIG
jgi:hypothetical protein